MLLLCIALCMLCCYASAASLHLLLRILGVRGCAVCQLLCHTQLLEPREIVHVLTNRGVSDTKLCSLLLQTMAN